MIDRKALKSAARAAMKEAKPHPFWITLAVSAILAVLMFLAAYIGGSFETYRELFRQIMSGELLQNAMSDTGVVLSSSGETGGFGSFLVLALELMAGVLSVGYILYCLRVSRHIRASVGDVFDVFGVFLRAVLVRVLRSLILFAFVMVFSIALSVLLTAVLLAAVPASSPEAVMEVLSSPWLILTVAVLMYIPIILATYFYRLAEYFMLDNPGLSALQSLSMSRMAMRGHKWELFKLDLSFLGWYLLSLVPFVSLWVQPYKTITVAGFYNEIAPLFMRDMEQRLRARTQASPDSRPGHGYSVPGQSRDDDDETES